MSRREFREVTARKTVRETDSTVKIPHLIVAA
jgi:hypothetical protein